MTQRSTDPSHANPAPDRDGEGPPTLGTALVTGASGYIGSHLVPRLLEAGWAVRVLARHPDKLAGYDWLPDVEVVAGDATDADDLARAADGADAAYFLLHSMDGGDDFAQRDRELAEGFARACEVAGVSRIVYLGGLHPEGEKLSKHLASRVEVGRIFLDCTVPAVCLQAAVVLGDGSVSFDMLRFLTERLPAIVAPKWLDNRIQPIAVDDVMRYLVAAASFPPEVDRAFDIGGPEVLTYADMMRRFAQVAGLRPRRIATLPVLTPGLAAHWVGLVTPVSSAVARPLVGSLVHEVVCAEDDIVQLCQDPPGGRIGFDDAVRRALRGATPSTGPRNLALTSAATIAAAAVGSVATTPDSPWYTSLAKPGWQPPPVAFPVVWTSLYASIAGTSASVITHHIDAGDRQEAAAYARALGINLALNAGWSVLFFRAHRLPLATAAAVALAGSSADLARRAGKAGSGHAKALAPYAGWCAFATALCFDVARRNRGARSV